jgi:RimJ/RimL family protein N-acetyltransferase
LTDGVVTLRLWVDADAAERAAALGNDAEIVRWTDLPEDYTEAEAARDIRRGHELQQAGERLSFAITDAAGRIIGGIDLMLAIYERAELGYVVTPPARRQGNATRAVRLLTAWALSTSDVHRVELPVPVGNVASRGVAVRAGFPAEGTLRSYLALRDGGPRHDVTMFALLHPPTS